MEYNRNARYFTKAGIGKIAAVCWPVAAVGVVVVFLRLGWWTYLLGGTVALAALACGCVCSGISVSDKEYDRIVAGMIAHFRKQFSAFVDEKLNQHNGRGKAPVSADETKMKFANVYFYDETALHRVGQDGRRRSNQLVLSAFYCDKQMFYVGYELVGITVERHEERFGAYAYADVESVTADRPEPRSEYAEYDRVTIKLKNKQTPVTVYMANDAELDTLLETVRARIGE